MNYLIISDFRFFSHLILLDEEGHEENRLAKKHDLIRKYFI